MEVLPYQPHSGKYSPFAHNGLLPTSSFRTLSSSNSTSRQSSTPNQNKPSDGVSQLREIDDKNGDESSDDEFPSLRKLLSPSSPPHNNPPSQALDKPVQTARSSAMTSPGLTSPREPWFNYPKWSLIQNPPAEAPNPQIQAETDGGNSQEYPIVIDDDGDGDDGDLTDRSDHILHQGDAGGATRTVDGVAGPSPDVTTKSWGHDRYATARSVSFSPEIPETPTTDIVATRDEEGQLSSVQGDPFSSPSVKRGRNLSKSGRPDGRGKDWVFDVFAEDDGATRGDELPSSKRVRPSPPPLKATEERSSPIAAVAVKDIQSARSVHGEQTPRGNQEYEVQQIVCESGLEYEVIAVTRIWLPKASVGPKLVRKYRAEQRIATRVRTRWSSRLQNRG